MWRITFSKLNQFDWWQATTVAKNYYICRNLSHVIFFAIWILLQRNNRATIHKNVVELFDKFESKWEVTITIVSSIINEWKMRINEHGTGVWSIFFSLLFTLLHSPHLQPPLVCSFCLRSNDSSILLTFFCFVSFSFYCPRLCMRFFIFTAPTI